MGRVTAIVESHRKPGRFVVQVDDRDFATASLDMLDRLALRVGLELDEAATARIRAEAETLQTYDRAVNMLAVQPRSSKDLRRRLTQKGETAANVDLAIERLTANGLLDDAQFARQFTRSRVTGQGASRRRLQQELYKRGVDRDAAAGAIEEVMGDEAVDEAQMVERAARKKARALAKLDAPTRRRRLYAFLARRGYDSDLIRQAMHTVLAEADSSALDDDLALDGGESVSE